MSEQDLEKALLPIRKRRLYEDVELQLMELITQGIIKPGNKFPSETELIKRFGVSRSILREAFRILETRGIVQSVQGGGRYLRSSTIQNFNDQPKAEFALERSSLLEVCEVRLALEPMAAALAAQRASDGELSELEQQLLGLRGQDRNDEEDFRFHLMLARISGNSMLNKLITEQINIVGTIRDEIMLPIIEKHRMEDFIADHTQILQALRTHDDKAASEDMYRHIWNSYILIKK